MGRYINQTTNGPVTASAKAKIEAIVNDGGVVIPQPTEFVPNLVCVVDNGAFGAAAYAFDEREMKVFQYHGDYRPKVWIIWDKVETFAQ